MDLYDVFWVVRLLVACEFIFVFGTAMRFIEWAVKHSWERLEKLTSIKISLVLHTLAIGVVYTLFAAFVVLAVLNAGHPLELRPTHANTPSFTQERKIVPMISKDLDPFIEIDELLSRSWSMAESALSTMWLHTDSAYQGIQSMRAEEVPRWALAALQSSKPPTLRVWPEIQQDIQQCLHAAPHADQSIALLLKNIDWIGQHLEKEELRRRAFGLTMGDPVDAPDRETWLIEDFVARLSSNSDITHAKTRLKSAKTGLQQLQANHRDTADPCLAKLYGQMAQDLDAAGLSSGHRITREQLKSLDRAVRKWI